VWGWKGGMVRPVVRLSGAVRWPMLVADLEDTGDLKLVAPVDGATAALVTEEATGGSFNLMALAGRPMGPLVAYQLNIGLSSVLSVPSGPTQASLISGDSAPAGRLGHEQAILVPGTQLTSLVPGQMHGPLSVPPGIPYGSTGTTGTTGTTGGSGETPTASTSKGFSCATVPEADALGLILLVPMLFRRTTGRTGPRSGSCRRLRS